ncbi:ankyrin [Penicillium concentricum]|uniref:Ankyrin n=1 Tax=Penicillium concentricum TaxID=293559 RepID=A0A9W9S938_9EURO|nr:ankyrin [Penicillium concentricum]KAJ5371848.1 ankyrin [Penicillium concentricum]
MLAAARDGQLGELQNHFKTWDTERTEEGAPATSRDHLWFKPLVSEQLEIFNELNRPKENTKKIHTDWYIRNRILVEASQKNRVNVVEYLLEQRDCPITSRAVQRAMMGNSFDVLELFLSHGWDINQPIQNNICTILRQVVSNENRVRWCLEHGANPNARSKDKIKDVLSHAACCASLSTLKLLDDHGADFARSNALQAAVKGPSERRMEIVRWLLDEKAFPINQREFEYDMEMFADRQSNGLATALHIAAETNSLDCLRFLLERGADAKLPDTLACTAEERGHKREHQEAVSLLRFWEG